jgi:Sec63 Brl domain
VQVRWPIDRREADDPHAKAGLLLQAHLGRSPLPVSDYFTDTRTVLDNSLRILQVRTLQRPAQLGLECRLLAAHPVSCASMGTGMPTDQFNLWKLRITARNCKWTAATIRLRASHPRSGDGRHLRRGGVARHSTQRHAHGAGAHAGDRLSLQTS